MDEIDDEIRRRERQEEDLERGRVAELRWKRYSSPSRRALAERYHESAGREGRWTPSPDHEDE